MLLNILNIILHQIQDLFLGEARCVERPQNLLLCLLILSLDVFGDQLIHLNGGSCISARHDPATISPIFLESDYPQVVVDKLEEIIRSGGQPQILSRDQAQETLGSGELPERDLLLGELLDLG